MTSRHELTTWSRSSSCSPSTRSPSPRATSRAWSTVFTPDGTYSAFGDTYTLDRFPVLVDAAPKGLFMTGTALVDLVDGADTATGTQPLCFIEHSKHDMRIGYYRDTYVRTDDGWRLKTRAMTFIRRSGDHDHGRPHAIGRPEAG